MVPDRGLHCLPTLKIGPKASLQWIQLIYHVYIVFVHLDSNLTNPGEMSRFMSTGLDLAVSKGILTNLGA